jgi:hypothetical protein
MNESTNQPQSKTPGEHRLATARRVLAYGLAVLFGPLVLLVAWAVVSRARSLPPLERADFDAARQRWSQAAPTDYDLEVVVEGRQPATYRVEVRGGEVQVALRNGLPLTQPRTMGTWSVPGMFGTIEIDLENVERSAEDASPTPDAKLLLRARFDGQYGYPARYHRIELVRHGVNPEVSWTVTKFDVLRP